MSTHTITARRLLALNIGIAVSLIVAGVLAIAQAFVGHLDGRGLLAGILLILVAVLATIRRRVESGL